MGAQEQEGDVIDEPEESPELWTRLERLRQIFLGREDAKGPAPAYWKDGGDLAAYDATFARRIAVKWDRVLDSVEEDLRARGPRTWFDWGCGSGVASERLLERGLLDKSLLWDHSALARGWTAEKLKTLGVSDVEALDRDRVSYAGSGVLLSHVLNEMSLGDRGALLNRLGTADAIIWVEAGSKATSRRLSECRNILLRRNPEFKVWSPCPHAGACGMITQDERANDWCHFFADAPGEFHQSAFWREFSSKMGIDLRSLPFSTIVLSKQASVGADISDRHRIVGTPRVYKGYLKLQTCHGREGVGEYNLPQRADKQLFKQLSDPPSMAIASFELDAEKKKITAGKVD
ncbi:MAG: small ribosomal subunit Rsm22 family protein [Bdellovibrionota bacterium]